MNDHDWELVNAYHDGELDAATAQALEQRFQNEPQLAAALGQVAAVSSSLRALRPGLAEAEAETEAAAAAAAEQQALVAANENRRPLKWLVGGAMAAVLALAAVIGSGMLAQPTLFDLHRDLATLPATAADPSGIVQANAGGAAGVPDLSPANLRPIAFQPAGDGTVTHYVGRNGCRLSFFRNVDAPPLTDFPSEAQVTLWQVGTMAHMIVATGMDQGKFDAIAAYLKRMTRQEAADQTMAALSEATTEAAPCIG